MKSEQIIDLNQTAWFNLTGIERVCKWMEDDIASLCQYVENLQSTPGDPAAMAAIDKAVNLMNDALLAAKLKQSAYRKTMGTKLALVAAE